MNYLKYIDNALAIHKDKAPKYLIFFVTSKCNANCVFCHYREQIEDRSRKGQELTVEEIRQIARKYGKVSKLSFSGGEPFMREDLPEIVKTFIEHCQPDIIDIPTNGGLVERIEQSVPRILDVMDGQVLDIQLSIDGPEEIHDQVRGVPGLFRRSMETYALLSRLRQKHPNLRLKMNLVYFSENMDAIRELAAIFESGYDFDRFQITYPHGVSVEDAVTSRIDFEKFHMLSKEIQKRFRIRSKLDLHSLIFRAVKMARDDILRRHHILVKDMGAVCRAGERILVLDEIGNVYPCEPLWDSVGNLREAGYDVREILRGPRMRAFAQKHLGPGKCTCSWGCVALEKIIYSPRLYPRLLANIAYLVLLGGRGFARGKPAAG